MLKGKFKQNEDFVTIYSPFGSFFLLLNTKEDILNNVGNQTVSVPIDFNCMNDKNISQNIFCSTKECST